MYSTISPIWDKKFYRCILYIQTQKVNFILMKLKNIMTKDVAVVSPETSIEEAEKMQDLNIGSVPVVENSKVKGYCHR